MIVRFTIYRFILKLYLNKDNLLLFINAQDSSDNLIGQNVITWGVLMDGKDMAYQNQSSAYVCQLFTSCSPAVHQLFTSCSPAVHQLFTSCSPAVHQLFTSCSPAVHQLFTSCSPAVHQLFTSCSPAVHQLFTSCSPAGFVRRATCDMDFNQSG